MNIRENISLARHSTMRLGGKARFLAIVDSKEDLLKAIDWARQHSTRILMIGHGSNIVWRDAGFDGLVLVNNISGFEVNEQDDKFIVTIAAGEIWDRAVDKLVERGLSGIEQLSLIPGTVGATPVQNVGAYGRELSDVLLSVAAYDLKLKKFVEIPNADCGFAYRQSRFNRADKGRFLIISITIALAKKNPAPPFYRSLANYLSENKITHYTPQNIRGAVIAIRSAKLPDPAKVANCGSFFANPILNKNQFASLKRKYPDIPSWRSGENNYKISAAWMLDFLGLKGYRDELTGMSLWHNQPLVFVNQSAKNTADLLAFKRKILDKAGQEFGVHLKQEPELI